MALRAGYDLTDWESIFTNAGITTASAKIYAQTFSSEGITRDTIHMLDRTMLKELGIKNMGEVLIILKLAKENPASPTTHVTPTAKPPQLNSGMTPQQFRKFKIDWDVFTKMTNLSDTQMNVQLYNCAEETVQNSIINTYPEFFNADPNKLLDMLEVLVTMKSNPIVHRISFSSIAQGDGEPVSDYLIRLRSGARDCNFICPNCDHDLSGIYVKDQFIRGIANDALQADLLAKAGSLETLEQNVSHAQAFEMALRDQNKMSSISDIARLQMSAYRQQKRAQNTIRPTATNNRRRNIMEIQSQRNACRGCGSFQHGKTGSGDRPRMCPAWGQTCRACGKENHVEGVCQSKGRVRQGSVWSPEDEEAVMDALIAHMVFDPATNTYKPGNHISREEVEATLIPFSPCPDPRRAEDIPSFRPTKLRIYPDSGATICLGGTKHLRHMGISEKNLVPSSKKVRTVGGFSLTCQGWLPVAFKVGKKTTKQALYICRNVQILYFSTDGGQPFTSTAFQEFLQTWGVKHRRSSVAYPQSNGRAELAVKTAKRIVNGNTDTQGSLDNDKAARAILQYRNTPIQGIGLSPAQLLLHRRLRDSIPSQPFLYKPHPEWIAAAQRRELILQKRNAKLVERYNRHTHNLCPLQAGDTVTIQNPLNRRWNTTGKIISALPERQYKIRVDGSGRITLRNRRFLKKCNLKPTPTPIPSATLGPRIPSTNATVTHPPLSPCDSTCTATKPQQQTTHISPRLRASRIPRALSRLLPHNKPGIKERHTSQATRPTRGGGRGDVERNNVQQQ